VAGGIQPVEIVVKTNMKSVDALSGALDRVEKQVGKVNKTTIFFDASGATNQLKDLKKQLEKSEKFVDQFLGRTNAARKGVGAFDNSLVSLRQQLSLVRKGFEDTNDDIKRQERGVALLAGQYKRLRLEGRALAQGAAGGQGFAGLFGDTDDAKLGIGSLENRIKELNQLPKSIAGNQQKLKEINFLLDFASAESKEFLMLVKAQNRALDEQKALYSQIKSIQRDMTMTGQASQLPANYFTNNPNFIEPGLISRTAPSIPKGKPKGTGAGKSVPFSQSRAGQAALGAGFPLLFGAGPASALGGGIGGFMGGFAGGIVGSVIGQSIDQFVQGMAEVGTALLKPVENIDLLVVKIGAVNTELEANIGVLQSLGLEGVAAQAAFEELESAVGKGGVKSLEEFGKSWSNLMNAFNRLGVIIGSALAAPLALFIDLITELVGILPGVKPGKTVNKPGKMSLIGELPTRIPDATGNSEQAIEGAMGRQVALAEAKTNLEAMSLTTRRDTLAVKEGEVKLQKIDNDLATLNANIDSGGLKGKKLINAEHDRTLLINKRNLEVEKQRNALTKAQRAILRERIGVQNRLLGLIGQRNGVEIDTLKATNGQFNAREEEFNQIEQTLSLEKARLANQLETNLLGKQEGEITVRLRAENEFLVKLAEDRARLEKTLLIQKHAEYDLGRLQVQQALDLQKVEARMDAQRKIRQTSPFARKSFLTDPFFGRSRELAANQETNFQEQVEMMRFQLNQNQAGLDVAGISEERREALEDQRAQLELNLATFEKYQPAIDEAALAQARFSDALAITKPVTDSLFDSLLSVVDGTKTAKEAFADFLKNIADILAKAAKEIIATYIAIGVARLFSGITSASTSAPKTMPDAVSQGGSLGGFHINGADLGIGFANAANGGPVFGGSPTIVGERGPELFVPSINGSITSSERFGADMANAMAVPFLPGGNQGGTASQMLDGPENFRQMSVPFTRTSEAAMMAAAEQQTAEAILNPAPLDVRFESQSINGVEYVTAEQHQTGMVQAAERGRALALAALQNSVKARRRVGL